MTHKHKRNMSKPDAKLITNKSNIAYHQLTGSADLCCLPKNNYLLDFRYIERAKSTIPACIKLINIIASGAIRKLSRKLGKNSKNTK